MQVVNNHNKQHNKEMNTEQEQAIVEAKELRNDIGLSLQKIGFFKPSRECSLTITKLQEAIMWLDVEIIRLTTLNLKNKNVSVNTIDIPSGKF